MMESKIRIKIKIKIRIKIKNGKPPTGRRDMHP